MPNSANAGCGAAVVATGERRHVFFEAARGHCRWSTGCYVGGEGEEAEGGLRAPMPGKVIALLAEPGAVLEKGLRCWFSRR